MTMAFSLPDEIFNYLRASPFTWLVINEIGFDVFLYYDSGR